MTYATIAPDAVTATEREEAPLSPAVRALADLLVARLPSWEHMREIIQGALADPDQTAWDETAALWERANDRAYAALSEEQRQLYNEAGMLAIRLDDLVTGHRVLGLLGTLLGE